MAARAASGSRAKRHGTGPFRQSPSKKSPMSGHSARRVVTTVSLNSGFGVRIEENVSFDMLATIFFIFLFEYHGRTVLYLFLHPKMSMIQFYYPFHGNHPWRKIPWFVATSNSVRINAVRLEFGCGRGKLSRENFIIVDYLLPSKPVQTSATGSSLDADKVNEGIERK